MSAVILTTRTDDSVTTTTLLSERLFVSDSTESVTGRREFTDSVSCSLVPSRPVVSTGGSGIECLDWSMSVTAV